MKLIYGWWIFIITLFEYSSVQTLNFSVSMYGAKPDDNIDDTNAIQSTINLAMQYGPNNAVIFGSGTYTITSPLVIRDAINLTITGQGMDKTLLVGTMPTNILVIYTSQQILLTSLAFDVIPFSFTGGYVVNITDTYLDLQVQPPHQADVGRQVPHIYRFDPVLMRPAIGPKAYQKKQMPPPNINTTLVSSNILRVPLASPSEFVIGDAIVVRYVFRSNAIDIQHATDLTVRSIAIYGSWCMGFFASHARRVNIIDYHVLRKDQRWLSSSADCIHFADAREYINIFDSQCIGMSDDGLNVHATYFSISRIINSTTIMIQTNVSADQLDFDASTHLEFSSNAEPFTGYATATIASMAEISYDTRIFTFTDAINASVGDWVCVADTPVLTVRNLTIANNRGRGVLLETRNIHITQSVFNGISGSAVYFQPSQSWREGPTARNVTLDYNLYINCNEGIDQYSGMILFLADPVQLVPIVSDIRITSSTFIMGAYSNGLLQIGNGANVSLSGNYIVTNNSVPLVTLCNSRNITASNNTLVNQGSKIDPYYIYLTTSPCNVSLSSLIDIPPSAFNSSFGPPVSRQ
jgi:hypothetical protein